jgi:alpha-glucosidase
VLNGQIGDYITVARRSGRDWFVGSMADEQPKTLSVPLRFLEPRTRYVANIYGDAPTTELETNPNQVQVTRLIVGSGDTLVAPLAGGGGQAVQLTQASPGDISTLPGCGPATPLCERGE